MASLAGDLAQDFKSTCSQTQKVGDVIPSSLETATTPLALLILVVKGKGAGPTSQWKECQRVCGNLQFLFSAI